MWVGGVRGVLAVSRQMASETFRSLMPADEPCALTCATIECSGGKASWRSRLQTLFVIKSHSTQLGIFWSFDFKLVQSGKRKKEQRMYPHLGKCTYGHLILSETCSLQDPNWRLSRSQGSLQDCKLYLQGKYFSNKRPQLQGQSEISNKGSSIAEQRQTKKRLKFTSFSTNSFTSSGRFPIGAVITTLIKIGRCASHWVNERKLTTEPVENIPNCVER